MILRAFTLSIICFCGATLGLADDIYYPGDQWESVEAASVGWDAAQLDAALDYAMKQKSSGVVILHRGRLLAERHHEVSSASARYRNMLREHNAAGHAVEDVASVQKSVVSFLVGVAREKGLVQLDDPVSKHLGVGWSHAAPKRESAITLRHLITMSSGLTPKLKYAAAPGEKWQYNTTAYSRSLTVICKAAGLSENELTRKWLTEPIGMTDSRWVERRRLTEETDANRFGFATTARDLARFGLLMLQQGRWQDQTLLADRNYIVESTSSSQPRNQSYGYLWWLNGQPSAIRGSRKVSGPLVPTAPADMYAGYGALGRKCYVVPSLELVVTRLGDAPEGRFDVELWRRLSKAAPE